MYKHAYTAKIGFTKVLDRTCAQCGGMYSSNEKSVCPKCNNQLVVPTFKAKDGSVRPYLMTEVTLYPLMRQDDRQDFEARTERAKGLGHLEIKMVLWGRYDKETNTVVPDARTQYLVPKRTVRVEFNTPPILRPYVSQKNNGQQRVEFKYALNSNRGDELEFLDSKQTAETMQNEAQSGLNARKAEASANGATNTNPNPAQLAQQFAALLEQASKMGIMPGNTPAQTQSNASAPVPDAETPNFDPNLDADDDGGFEGVDAFPVG